MFRFAVLLASAAAIAANVHDRAYYEEKFYNWLSLHKIQPLSGQHFVEMLKNFANNDDIIEQHNASGATYELGHNQFSHLSVEEWRAYVRLGLDKPDATTAPAAIHAAPADMSAVPASVDWTTAGAVTGVKDQGQVRKAMKAGCEFYFIFSFRFFVSLRVPLHTHSFSHSIIILTLTLTFTHLHTRTLTIKTQCGSCWSFSAVGALEGAYELKYGSLVSFSEQNFVDCDNRQNGGKDHGCSGGLMDNAFTWAKSNGGVCTEAAYPYTSGTTKTEGTCSQSKCTKNAQVAPKSYTDVQTNSDSAMMSALAQQPVSVAIEADQSSFQLYKSGVFTGACGTKLDHGT